MALGTSGHPTFLLPLSLCRSENGYYIPPSEEKRESLAKGAKDAKEEWREADSSICYDQPTTISRQPKCSSACYTRIWDAD